MLLRLNRYTPLRTIKKIIRWGGFWLLLFPFSVYGQFTNVDRYFSPNLDGTKDFIEIPFTIEEPNLQKWSLTIARKEGDTFKRVMTHHSINPKEERLNFSKFFSRIVAKDTPLKAPDSFLWEGRDDKGNSVEDGTYYFTISAVDKWGNKSSSPLIPIVVDTVSPESEFTIETDIFSPNGDGRKETLPVKVLSRNFSSPDRWTLTVSDVEGKIIKQFTSDNPNTTIAWDGLTDSGEEALQGSYYLSLTSEDFAGNRYSVPAQKVILIRDFEQIGLEITQPIFSPNGDGYFDNVSFETTLSSLEGMESWSLEIKDETEKIVKSFANTTFNKVIFYEGTSDGGEKLPDGNYTSQLRAWFRSGNQPNSETVPFTIDTQPPQIAVKLRNKILNPNAIGSGFRDISIENSYDATETNNTYQISILNQNGDIVLEQNYLSTSPPQVFLWNGKSKDGEVLTGKYVYVFKAKDEVENISSVVSDPFEVIDDNLRVGVQPDSTSISPNGDGQLDKITFTFEVNEKYRDILVEGHFTIYNTKQEEVKKYSLTAFPDSLVWDGLIDPQFHRGQMTGSRSPHPLPDGVYSYIFTARFETQEEISLSAKNIYLDTTPVQLELFPHEKIFSPNGDGNKDQIIFSNRYTPSASRMDQDQFDVFIVKKEEDQEVIYRHKKWKGNFPSELLWTGRDQVDEDSPAGVYQLRIETIDHAFNKKTYLSQPYTLVRDMETLDLKVSPSLLTSIPEGDPHQLSIIPEVSSSQGFEGISYFLFLSNEKKTAFAYRDTLNPVTWNLLQQNQESADTLNLSTGLYYLQAVATYESGNSPDSPVKEIYIDNDYPLATVNTQPLFFSPDGDEINDELNIRIIAEDNYKIKQVSAALFRLEENGGRGEMTPKENYEFHHQRQIPLKTWSWDFHSRRFDNQFVWDGRGDLGDLVESATDYILFVRVRDQVGLPVTIQHQFLVDILVEKLDDGRLRIILKSINFKYDSEEMLGNYEKVLDLLIRMLRRFPEYDIHIVGHTDSRGSHEYNDVLSVKRAQAVQSYLIDKGISEDRLTSQGKGKRELLISPEKEVNPQFTGEIREKIIEDNYRKNRRVEFFLNKEK